MTIQDATRLMAFCRYAPPTSHIKTHKVAKEQRMPHTRWSANRPTAAGTAIPTAARRPSAHSISFPTLSDCNATNASHPRCNLDPEITPDCSTFIDLFPYASINPGNTYRRVGDRKKPVYSGHKTSLLPKKASFQQQYEAGQWPASRT